jgi:hypothetical protein
MARLGDELQAIRQHCDVDRGSPKPVVCIAQRRVAPELTSLRLGVSNLVLQALLGGVSNTDILIAVGVGIDAGVQLAALPIEKFNAR